MLQLMLHNIALNGRLSIKNIKWSAIKIYLVISILSNITKVNVFTCFSNLAFYKNLIKEYANVTNLNKKVRNQFSLTEYDRWHKNET